MPAKKTKTTRARRPAYSKWFREAARVRAIKRVSVAPTARAILIAVVCVMGAGILVAARRSAPAADIAAPVAADKALAADMTTPGPDAEPIAPATFPKVEPITVTGCLEQSNDSFRLKNTTGDEAPKSRNWKSGFLRKRAAQIDVIDSGRRLKLPNHVGERVSVTGVMMNREMQARSLQRVASACN